MKELFRRHRRLLSYLFWGAATTAVNYGVYFLLTRLFTVHYIISNISAWFVSVVFAFWANKVFVFRSDSWTAKTALPEFGMFIGARLFSGFLETGLLWLGVDLAHYNDTVVKILVSILIVILNYLFSKFFIFRSRRH